MKYKTSYQGKLGYKFFKPYGDYSSSKMDRVSRILFTPLFELWQVVYPVRDEAGQWVYKPEVINLISEQFDIVRTVHGSSPEAIETFSDISKEIKVQPGQFVLWSVYSKIDGGFVGDVETAYRKVQRGLTKIQKAVPESSTCCIGYNASEQKWYGWSHRAIYGFGIGSMCIEGDCGYEYMNKGFKATNLRDAKKMAIAFSRSVS